MSLPEFGQPVSRKDGRAKVTGAARYTAEIPISGVAHAVLVPSAITHGRLARLDILDAERAPGVMAVLTHTNMPKLMPAPVLLSNGGQGGSAGQAFLPMQGDVIVYTGQPIALVVAQTLEQAQTAAALVSAEYDPESHQLDFEAALATTFIPDNGWPEPASVTRGDAIQGLNDSDAKISVTYHTALQHHVTMEPHATLAVWEGEHLTVYEPSTFVYGAKKAIATWLSISEENVRVVAQYVGGSFGCKGPVWPHVALTAVAARVTGRPVKLALTRAQTFTSVGYRPRIRHAIQIGAAQGGALRVIAHHATAHTATFDTRIVAPVTKTTPRVYACPNVETTYRMAHMNLTGPFTMRGPGETPGLFALECALDELSYALNMDPLALRLKNYAETDPEDEKPYTSKSLRECYRQGAERFGWHRRAPEPGSMKTTDGKLLGLGMATMMYDAKSAPATARAQISGDGRLLVQSATCDQGTGSYTILCQIAADALNVPLGSVRVELGDTNLPHAPIAAGSQTTASVGAAVQAACASLRRMLLTLASEDLTSPLHGRAVDTLTVETGRVFAVDGPATGEPLAAVAARRPGGVVAAQETVDSGKDAQGQGRYSFGAHFAEVHVDPDLGETRVHHYVAAFGAGRIVNAKTAHSQLIGGIVWGIGMALMEETHVDARLGRIVNADLAEYHVPVNADIPEIDAFFVQEDDARVNPLGVKGIGEIGTIGAAAAIANAVYHATGTRVRDLPITPDKLLSIGRN